MHVLHNKFFTKSEENLLAKHLEGALNRGRRDKCLARILLNPPLHLARNIYINKNVE